MRDPPEGHTSQADPTGLCTGKLPPVPQVTHHPIPSAGSSSSTRTIYSKQVSSFREKLNSRILRPAVDRGQVGAPRPPESHYRPCLQTSWCPWDTLGGAAPRD